MKIRSSRAALACLLVAILVAGSLILYAGHQQQRRLTVVGYFANSDGIFVGDEVRILGVPVGQIDRIEPLPGRARITFWVDRQYSVPANVNAVIISPTLISARAIQLTPAYTDGPRLGDGAVLGPDHTAVPVEWDDFREQLEKLTGALQPGPDGLAPLGKFINTAADSLRGNSSEVRSAITELAAASSALGDHSDDIFSTVRSVALLTSALRDSSDVLGQLNRNLAAVAALLDNSPDEITNAITSLEKAAGDLNGFLAETGEPLGVAVDKTTEISTAINEVIYDVKQVLHIAPTLFANFINIYQPAQGAITGALAFNNFADPIQFICSAIQAASRLGNEQAAKLCVQYLAPIIKNRRYNFPPLGENLVVGAAARPNEITYSEDRLRPDYQGPQTPPPVGPPPEALPDGAPLPAAPTVIGSPEDNASAAPPAAGTGGPGTPPIFPPERHATDPNAGLPGLMVPATGTP